MAVLYPLYAISGISGSGKTTLGKALTKKLEQLRLTHIDQDDYYLPIKPEVTLSDCTIVSNWDCLEALDSNFTNKIKEELANGPVILTGFALCRQVLPVVPIVHIHLITATRPETLEERCCKVRRKAKKINVERDAKMVREIVIPFYHKMVRNSDITHVIQVIDEDCKNVPLDWLVKLAKDIILDSHLARQTHHVMDVSEPYYSLIKSGEKVVEGRKYSTKWRVIRKGDIISMTCPSKDSFDVKVKNVNLYLPSCGDPLTSYLENETLERALPGVTTIREGRNVYLKFYTEEDCQRLGMMGICVERI